MPLHRKGFIQAAAQLAVGAGQVADAGGNARQFILARIVFRGQQAGDGLDGLGMMARDPEDQQHGDQQQGNQEKKQLAEAGPDGCLDVRHPQDRVIAHAPAPSRQGNGKPAVVVPAEDAAVFPVRRGFHFCRGKGKVFRGGNHLVPHADIRVQVGVDRIGKHIPVYGFLDQEEHGALAPGRAGAQGQDKADHAGVCSIDQVGDDPLRRQHGQPVRGAEQAGQVFRGGLLKLRHARKPIQRHGCRRGIKPVILREVQVKLVAEGVGGRVGNQLELQVIGLPRLLIEPERLDMR